MTARDTDQRHRDTLARLEQDVDVWVATADGGTPYLVPLSFRWDGSTLLVATPASSPTGRNLQATGRARLALGVTRDVVLVEGDVVVVEPDPGEADAFAAKAGFDPRSARGYLYFRVTPRRVQAWREVDELAGRELMREGRWIAG
jgi:hypothetical protein